MMTDEQREQWRALWRSWGDAHAASTAALAAGDYARAEAKLAEALDYSRQLDDLEAAAWGEREWT